MAFVLKVGRGLRRYDEHAASTNKMIGEFTGLPLGSSPTTVIGWLKKAAPYMDIPLRLVSLIDLLFAWTKPQDWADGRLPVVWPSNDLLAQKLGVSIRQVQKLLKHAQVEGLLGFADSPNGHRGGRRGADGQIVWGYGIVLAPLGTRLAEFERCAVAGAAEDAALTVLRKRLAAARRSIRSVAQAFADAGSMERQPRDTLDLAQMAAAQMKGSRDASLLAACVDEIEARARSLRELFAATFAEATTDVKPQKSSCWRGVADTHSTTTTDLQSAKADTGNGFAEKSSGEVVARSGGSPAEVDADLARYGVCPEVLTEVAPDLLSNLPLFGGTWAEIVVTAERLAGQSGISRHAFHEACRIMGERGAAVSVITTLEKYRSGDVHRPGAYLRGMSRKAARGELNLGRTFHGLKDTSRVAAMRGLSDGTETMPVGALARRLLAQTQAHI